MRPASPLKLLTLDSAMALHVSTCKDDATFCRDRSRDVAGLGEDVGAHVVPPEDRNEWLAFKHERNAKA